MVSLYFLNLFLGILCLFLLFICFFQIYGFIVSWHRVKALDLFQCWSVLELLCQVVEKGGNRIYRQHMHGVDNKVISQSDEAAKECPSFTTQNIMFLCCA